jgi:DNA-binding NarL/FixJ family response regulator
MPKIIAPVELPATLPPTRVVMVEDDPVYRQFVRQVLRKIDGVELVAECHTGSEGVELVRRLRPEALLLDLLLPDQHGVEVVKTLRPEFPDMIVLLMTAHPSSDLPRELLKLGVQGFADKTGTAPDLTKTIRSVLAGGLSYTSAAGLAKPKPEPVIHLPGNAENVKPHVLTPREREIAILVAGAMSSKEVASRLELSTRTVEKHRANIYAKLGVRDVVGLTRWCLHHQLVS